MKSTKANLKKKQNKNHNKNSKNKILWITIVIHSAMGVG
jgi:hypothetical protein